MGNSKSHEVMWVLIYSSTLTFLLDNSVGEIGPSFTISFLEFARRQSVGTVFNLTITAILIATIQAKEAKLLS